MIISPLLPLPYSLFHRRTIVVYKLLTVKRIVETGMVTDGYILERLQ